MAATLTTDDLCHFGGCIGGVMGVGLVHIRRELSLFGRHDNVSPRFLDTVMYVLYADFFPRCLAAVNSIQTLIGQSDWLIRNELLIGCCNQ